MAHSDKSCPLCGEPFGDRELSVDHIFGESFGGRATVKTHRSCNNQIGRCAEGRLHRPGSILNIAKLLYDLQAIPVDGQTADGQPIKGDLASGTWSPSRPTFSKEETAEIINIVASGAPEQLAKMHKNWQKKWPGQVPSLDELRAATKQEPLAPKDVELRIEYDLNDTLAMIKKAALGAGVRAFGTEFATDPLAQAIRVADLGGQGLYQEGMDRAWEICRSQLTSIAADGTDIPSVPDVLPAPRHQVVFVPIAGQSRTAVFVNIMGVALEPFGILVDSSLPDSQYGPRVQPVLVREDEAFEIWDLNEIMIEVMTKQL